MKVPFSDLTGQYLSIRREIDDAIKEVLDCADFILGRQVESFEKQFAEYCGTKFAVGVGSGTAAIYFALRALDIGNGDEVIIPANAYFAAAEAVSLVNASPVFVDINPVTYAIDTEKLEKAVTRRSRVIMPVHMYGLPADMDPISEIAGKHGLEVVEDSCQGHGAEYKNKKTGSLGRIGCFSFYPGKNLGAFGEGGMITTDDGSIAEKIIALRNHGQSRKHHHDMIGWNSRLQGIQGAVLKVKLRYLDSWNGLRREKAKYYDGLMSDLDITLPCSDDCCLHVYHLYVVRAEKRDDLREYLQMKSIETGLHYPIPIHLQKAYFDLGFRKGSFPVAEKSAGEILSLPLYPELTIEQVDYVAASIRKFFETGG